MFNDDDNNDNFSIQELLDAYYSIKKGQHALIYLGTDEYNMLIDYFLYNNNYQETLHVIDLALSYYPSNIEILTHKAEILFNTNNFGQALQCIEKIETIEPYSYNAISLKAHIYNLNGRTEQAIDNLQNALDHVEEEFRIPLLNDLIDIYDEMDEVKKVFACLVRILALNPKDVDTLQKMSYWADISGEVEKSEKIHTEITDNDPFNVIAWYNLGSAQHAQKKYKEAIESYEYAIALDEKFEPAYRNLADVLMRTKAFDKALETLTANLEIGNAEDVIFEAMGHCFEKKKDFKKARYYYRQAVKLRPEDDMYFYKIAETYYREKLIESAYESYLTAFKLNPENYIYAYKIGECMYEMDMHKEAIVYFLKSINLKPGYKNAWVSFFRTLFAVEMYDDIILQKEHAEDNCGAKAEFEYIHVACLLALGKSKEAIERLHVAMQLSKTKFKILLELQPDALTRKGISDVWAHYKKTK